MKQLNCEQAKELFDQDIDGEITEQDKTLLHAHLESCESCRHEYAQLKAVHACLRELTSEVPPELHGNVMAKIQKEKTSRAKFYRRARILAGTAAAAVVCVAVLHTPLLNVSKFAKEEADMIIEAPSEGATASAKKDFSYSADTPDGSFDISEDQALPETCLPEAQQNSYEIVGTPYTLWLSDEKNAVVGLTKDEKTELVLSAEYSVESQTLRITKDGKYQLFTIEQNTLVPTEGDLLENLNN